MKKSNPDPMSTILLSSAVGGAAMQVGAVLAGKLFERKQDNPRSDNAYLGDAVSLAKCKKDKEGWKKAGKRGPPPFCPTGNPGDLKTLKSRLLR
jgi:hypothetical protein